MPSIFISYRISDSADITGRIRERLADYFGAEQIFRDVQSIPLGIDYRDYINTELDNCQVMVVVIGPKWLSAEDAEGNRRLEQPDDWVRREIETALGREIPVIPVLVNQAKQPKAEELPDSLQALAYRNNTTARADPDFDSDMARLIKSLEAVLAGPRATAPIPHNLPRFPQEQAIRVKWQIVLDFILYSFDEGKKVESVVTELKRLSKDRQLKEDSRRCESNSTVVTLKGTEAGFRAIESLFNSGQLPEVCDLLVEQVSLVSNSGGSDLASTSLTSNPTSPAMTPPKPELTPKERLALSRQITGLTVQDFNDLLLLLTPPAGIVPPPSAPPGDRTYALLNWAQSTTGCGLNEVQTALNDIIP